MFIQVINNKLKNLYFLNARTGLAIGSTTDLTMGLNTGSTTGTIITTSLFRQRVIG